MLSTAQQQCACSPPSAKPCALFYAHYLATAIMLSTKSYSLQARALCIPTASLGCCCTKCQQRYGLLNHTSGAALGYMLQLLQRQKHAVGKYMSGPALCRTGFTSCTSGPELHAISGNLCCLWQVTAWANVDRGGLDPSKAGTWSDCMAEQPQRATQRPLFRWPCNN